MTQVSEITGTYPEKAFCDKGYRGQARHKEVPAANFIPGVTQAISVSFKQKLKRRNAVEQVIGHLKTEHGLDHNFLKGRIGDEINALMASCVFNLKKLLNHIKAFIYILFYIKRPQGMGLCEPWVQNNISGLICEFFSDD